jgi:glycosyltransferase involved in cell wall biosynthesis
MSKPLFSIIIPALNEEKFLPHLLESLAAQTEKNFEVIVVDGSSKDKTVALANSFRSKLPTLDVVVSKKASLPLQRNIGAQKAKGDWFIFIDADSVMLPYFLGRVETFIQEAHPKLMTTWCRPDSEIQGDAFITLFWNIALESLVRFKRPMAPGPLTIVDKETFHAVGGYDEHHAFNEDIDFSLRLDKKGIKLRIMRETLYVISLRRLRAQGTLRVVQQYAQAALPVLFFKRSLSHMPGYVMGGHLYGKKKLQPSTLKNFEKSLKKLLSDFFE